MEILPFDRKFDRSTFCSGNSARTITVIGPFANRASQA